MQQQQRDTPQAGRLCLQNATSSAAGPQIARVWRRWASSPRGVPPPAVAQVPRQPTPVREPILASPAQPVLHAIVVQASSIGCRLGGLGLGRGACTVSGCCILAPGRLLQNGHLTPTHQVGQHSRGEGSIPPSTMGQQIGGGTAHEQAEGIAIGCLQMGRLSGRGGSASLPCTQTRQHKTKEGKHHGL